MRRGDQPVIEVEAAVVEELGSATHVLFTIEAPPVDVDSVRAATDERERATLLATDRRASSPPNSTRGRRCARATGSARGRPHARALLRPGERRLAPCRDAGNDRLRGASEAREAIADLPEAHLACQAGWA